MPILTPTECRAARALLDWSQDDLALKSGVSKRAITNFEKGHTTPIRANLAAIKGALEIGGVEFLEDGALRLKAGRV
jgi:transcriptional regulator with XRE-family HTH domain